ncbi:hypothetical protein BJD55_gp149 [Gordonia phage Yvonnetastic]|uniref:Uncharacterized protein n=1 Tax=Gordonia phage Yvonnetastic TaxID=1821566 RepID=A0A142K934_9CAUD|nr:hypothetical protein BJD55_gp149 [Gordonia phage Yvonnetastic]AMS02617.1 hypothetical protein SEA_YVONNETASTIC_73 [Gordonia phage Yvonnetastic]
MTAYTFNSAGLKHQEPVDIHIPNTWIEGSPNLRRASLKDAVLFGGPAIQQLLTYAPIVGDRKHIFVDTKVSMLMPGWMPAIPGWHTDGVPRGDENDPAGTGDPNLARQLEERSPQFHTIIAGIPCLTEFLGGMHILDLKHDRSSKLYTEMNNLVEKFLSEGVWETVKPHPLVWSSWDWWQIHRATPSTVRGWRLLIRITESDTVPPADTNFIRTQNQVYVPADTGW